MHFSLHAISLILSWVFLVSDATTIPPANPIPSNPPLPNPSQIQPSKTHQQTPTDKSVAVIPPHQTPQPQNPKPPLKVLFLSSDTGGGHRASSTAIATQIQNQNGNPKNTVLLPFYDIWTEHGGFPYNLLVTAYPKLLRYPVLWAAFYHVTNLRGYQKLLDVHSVATCFRRITRHIEELGPDVVVAVHPTMTNLPQLSTIDILERKGKDIPVFTVVTDLAR